MVLGGWSVTGRVLIFVVLSVLAAAVSRVVAHDPPGGVFQGPGWDCRDEGPWSVCTGPFFGPTGSASHLGRWDPNDVEFPVQATHMIVVPTGEVMVFRGTYIPTTVYLFDPATRTFEGTDAVGGGDLFCSGHVTLADGRVAIVGGELDEGPPAVGLRDMNIFDPFTRQWFHGRDMSGGRWYPTATTLADGRVLAIGGRKPADENGPSSHVRIPEIYNPETNQWTRLFNAEQLMHPYSYIFVLPNKRVLFSGPRCDSTESESDTQVLNLNTGRWNVIETHLSACKGAAVMVRPGVVLKVGGGNPAFNQAEILDLNVGNPQWRSVEAPTIPRRRQDLVLLPTGKVLCVGGTRAGFHTPECAIHVAELWDPDTETWEFMASSQHSRMYHSSTVLLPDGRILAAGGEYCEGSTNLEELNGEFFEPPYLHQGSRPTISSVASQVSYGKSFDVVTPQAGSIDSVALLRGGAVTHNFDQNQRYVPLTFTVSGNRLRVDAPSGGGIAPPGYYMLFIVNGAGVPSVSRSVQVGESLPGGNGNVAPIAEGQSVTTEEDTALGITLTGTDSDSDPLTFLIASPPANGSLSGAPPNVSYTPTGDFNGADSFTFRANDGSVNSALATVNVTVTAVNDFPVANDRIVGTAPDMAVAFTLSATDAEGDTLSYTIVDLPGNGTLGGTPPDLTYTPFEGYLGTDELTFFANDGKGDSNIASVTVSILELPDAVLYLSVAPSANLGGLAVETCDIVAFDGIAFTVFFDGSDVGLSGLDLSAFDVIGAAEILVSFSEPMNHPDIPNTVDDSDILKFTAVQTGPDTAGTFEVYFDGSDVGLTTFGEGVDAVTLLDDGRCVLSVRGSVSVPGVDSANEDLLIFEATSIGDATSGSWSRYFDGSDVALAEGSEDVDGVAVDPSENILLSTVGAFSVSGVSGADEDILVFQPTQLGFSTTGTFSPNLLFDGSSFGVTGDITGFDVPTHTINEAPLAVDDSYSVDEDTVLTVSSGLGVLNDDTDPEDDPLAANEASSPTNGTLILAADGSFNYTPNAEFSGTDVFTYTAFDGTSSSPEATVTLTVNPINDAPSAEGQSVSTPEDTALPVVLVGHDHDSATLTYVVTDPANGMVTGTAPNLLYTPDPDYSGTDSFNFFVNDSESDSNTATITVNVTPVKDPPVALPQTVVTLEDFAVEIVLRGTDADDDPLSYRIADGPTVGRLSGTPPTVIYIPNSDSFGADSFTFIVSDGDDSVPAAVDLTITALNDAPLATGQTVAVEANRNRSILLTGSDVDGDELTYTVVAPPTHGVLSGTAPNLNYTPEPSYNGPDSFTFHVNDGEFDSTMSTVSIVVLGGGGAMTGISFSLALMTTLDDISVADEDVVHLDDAGFSLLFDGSDVGISGLSVNALDRISANEILLSFRAPGAVPGINGTVDGADIVLFTGTLGATTAGDFTLYFDGSDVGLTASDEGIDAVTLLASGNLLISTQGSVDVPGGLASDEDVLEFTPTSLGGTTAGSWQVYLDGSDVGIGDAGEDVDGLALNAVGDLVLSTAGSFSVPGLTGFDDDAFVFQATTLGTSTSGSFVSPIFFEGRVHRLSWNDLTGLDVPSVPSHNLPPVAKSQTVTVTENLPTPITLGASDPDRLSLTYTVGPTAQGTLSGTAPNLTYTPNPGFTGRDSFMFHVNDDVFDSTMATVSIVVLGSGGEGGFYFSVASSTTLGGVSVAGEDVIHFDGTGFSVLFDGSDVSIDGLVVDALDRIGANEILLSFTAPGGVPGIGGTVDDVDIVLFTGTLGAATVGSFSLYFDGSDVGLAASNQGVDAVTLLGNGNLLISTTDNAGLPGVRATDEDILQFTPTVLGTTTAGSWRIYFDGSDVGMGGSDVDVDALAVNTFGGLVLSTTGGFSMPGLAGFNADAFVFQATTLGVSTSGNFASLSLFEGAATLGLTSSDVTGWDLPSR